jgi:hypothetical protein
MQLQNGRLVRTDIWREGTYLDLWSVPHFLSGMSVALGLFIVGLDFNTAVVVGFFMLVAWEFFEYFAEIEEGRINSIMDIVVGMTSLVPTFIWAGDQTFQTVVVVFAAITVIDLILSTFGWIASHKANVLERKLKTEFKERREQLRDRRRLIKQRIADERAKWRARRKEWRAHKKDTGGAVTGENTA